MHVTNEALEFLQAIWFMLQRNAGECHVVELKVELHYDRQT
jgi:hypothetical protein